MIKIKRVYDAPSRNDGTRILVERLWPRGFTKERADIDQWLREVAPSAELRKWFAHDPAKWAEFRRRYLAELKREPAASAAQSILEKARRGPVTLVFSSRDEEHNNAVVLHEYLDSQTRGTRARRAA